MDWEGLYHLAARQHGVLRPMDAEKFGGTAAALRQFAARHGWSHPEDGVLVVPGHPETYEQRVMVAICALGGRVVAGRRTAAYLWGIRDQPAGRPEILVPYGRTNRPPAGVHLWRSRTVTADHVALARGIPVTNPARTILDLAAVSSVGELRSAVIDARQRRVVRLEDVDELYRTIRRAPGGGRLRIVLADLDARTCDSRLEHAFRQVCDAAGLQPYPGPFPFRCSTGRVLHIDAAFPEHWIAVECDGFGSHSERAHLQTDHVRQNLLVADGWRPFRVDWDRVTRDPAGMVRDLRRMMAEPAGEPPARPALM